MKVAPWKFNVLLDIFMRFTSIMLIVVFPLLLSLPGNAAGNTNSSSNSNNTIGASTMFVKDSKIQEEASKDAENAIKFASEEFDVKLDWTDESIEKVELILSSLHKRALKDKPTEKQIFGFARPLGSYIGEVYRRNHGAEWGIVTIDGDSYPGLKCGDKERYFWPWLKAQKRIENGEEDNVWHYFQMLFSEAPSQ